MLAAVAIAALAAGLSWRILGERGAPAGATTEAKLEPVSSPRTPREQLALEAPPARRAAAAFEASRTNAARDVLVVDQDDAPVSGAQLFEGAVWDSSGEIRGAPPCATTGADGRARAPRRAPETWVGVFAAGHRLVQAQFPAEDEAWIVRLPRANRIEIVLPGAFDKSGFHAEVELPRSFVQRTFHQGLYEQTPGRIANGARGRWSSAEERSTWSLDLASGEAVLDQIEEGGVVCVRWMRFGTELERRDIELAASGSTHRIEVTAPDAPPAITGTVIDELDAPIADARLSLAPRRGWLAADEFPVWAPSASTSADGTFRLPRPEDASELVRITGPGCAEVVLSIAELDQLRGRIRLDHGRAVQLQLVDREGKPIDAGSETGGRIHARPVVEIGHDVWRGPSMELEPPWFIFAGLPCGPARFRFQGLSESEELVHDANVATARYASPLALDEMNLGK